MRYDFIGDIHGHAQLLERILLKLGYQSEGNSYVASDRKRKVVFLGDYIDRGPQNRRVIVVHSKCILLGLVFNDITSAPQHVVSLREVLNVHIRS